MASVDALRGITAGSLKASGEQTTTPKTRANDGDDATTWGSGEGEPSIGVAGEWWAADLGPTGPAFKPFGAYRIRQMGGNAPNVQNVATEVRIYATDDADVWAALPASGKISTDPAANGWHLVATYTGSLAYTDTGRVPISPPEGGRYVLFRAVTGGTLDWDVETLEVWDYRGTSVEATRCDHDHLHGDRSHSTKREHAAIGVGYDNGASGLVAENVQDAVDELAAAPGGTVIVEEEDGTPTGSFDTIKFPNGSVTDNGDGSVSVDPGSAPPAGAAFPTVVQIKRNAANNTSLTVTLNVTPTVGNRIVLGIGLNGRASTGVSQTGVTWTKVSDHAFSTTMFGEIWVGVVGATPGTVITISTGSSNWIQAGAVEVPDALTPTLGLNAESSNTNMGVLVNTYSGVIEPAQGTVFACLIAEDNGTVALLLECAAPIIPVILRSGTVVFGVGYAPGGEIACWSPLGTTNSDGVAIICSIT